MSINTGYAPRHRPDGKFAHECATCGVTFRTNRQSERYCCFAHKQQSGNKRWYTAHRKEIVLAVMLRAARKRARRVASASEPKRASKRVPTRKTPAEMTESELIEYIRANPEQVADGRGRKR